MIEILLKFDTFLFHLINSGFSNSIFNIIMPIFHHTKYILPFLLFFWILAIIYDKKNRWKLLILIPIGIILVDQTGLFIKKTVLRPRPFVVMDPLDINHLVRPSGLKKSFPSNHAANNAFLAIFFSYIYNNLKYLFWGFAIIIMFSRIYIGVHYPSDVVFGCCLGIAYGLLLIKAWNYFKKSN